MDSTQVYDAWSMGSNPIKLTITICGVTASTGEFDSPGKGSIPFRSTITNYNWYRIAI